MVLGFDPTRPGDYDFTLKAFDGQTMVARTDMTVADVPLPPAALLGLGLLGGVGLIGRLRRRSTR